jgi:hypothetical protein
LKPIKNISLCSAPSTAGLVWNWENIHSNAVEQNTCRSKVLDWNGMHRLDESEWKRIGDVWHPVMNRQFFPVRRRLDPMVSGVTLAGTESPSTASAGFRASTDL